MESKFNLHDLFAKFFPGVLLLGGMFFAFLLPTYLRMGSPESATFDFSLVNGSAVVVALFCVPLAYVLGTLVFELGSLVMKIRSEKPRPSVTLVLEKSEKSGRRLPKTLCSDLVSRARAIGGYTHDRIDSNKKAEQLFQVCHTYLVSTPRYVRCEMFEAFCGMHRSMILVSAITGLATILAIVLSRSFGTISTTMAVAGCLVSAASAALLSVAFLSLYNKYDRRFAEWVYRAFLIESQSSAQEANA